MSARSPHRRLARVARVREVLEQVARAAWGRAEASAVEAEQRLDALRGAVRDARDQLARDQLAGRAAPARVLGADRALDGMLRGVRAGRARALELRERADASRGAWIGCDRDRRSLDLLIERRRETWVREQRKSEARALDEVALARFRGPAPAAGEVPSRSGSRAGRRPADD